MKGIKEIDDFLDSSIAAGEFAGAVYLIAVGDEVRAMAARGQAVAVPEPLPATVDTIFDIASLTKPVVTGMLLAQLIERGEIALHQPVSELLAEFDRDDKRAITIAQLASHSAGLAAWQPFYALVSDKSEVLSAIARAPLEYAPGTKVVYSDLGFITLGFLIERVAGKPLDQFARQMIAEPLGLGRTTFNPPQHWRREIAASETGNEYERKMAGAAAAHYTGWRHEVIWGQVHDHNCWFLGGVAGHAGLFAPARELLKLAQQFMPGSRLVRAETLRLFQENLTPGCEEGRSLAWVVAGIGVTSAGEALPAGSIGHTGFTGTSLWLDPEGARSYILLTNRTHPVYREFNMNERRRQFHRLAQSVF